MECGVGVSVVVTVIALVTLGSRSSSAIKVGSSRFTLLSSLTQQTEMSGVESIACRTFSLGIPFLDFFFQ